MNHTASGLPKPPLWNECATPTRHDVVQATLIDLGMSRGDNGGHTMNDFPSTDGGDSWGAKAVTARIHVDREREEMKHGMEVCEEGIEGGRKSMLFTILSREALGMIWRHTMAGFVPTHLQTAKKPPVDLALDHTDISQAEYKSYHSHFNWKGVGGADWGEGGRHAPRERVPAPEAAHHRRFWGGGGGVAHRIRIRSRDWIAETARQLQDSVHLEFCLAAVQRVSNKINKRSETE